MGREENKGHDEKGLGRQAGKGREGREEWKERATDI